MEMDTPLRRASPLRQSSRNRPVRPSPPKIPSSCDKNMEKTPICDAVHIEKLEQSPGTVLSLDITYCICSHRSITCGTVFHLLYLQSFPNVPVLTSNFLFGATRGAGGGAY